MMEQTSMPTQVRVQRAAAYVLEGETRFAIAGNDSQGHPAQWVIRASQLREEADRAALALAVVPFNLALTEDAAGTYGVAVTYSRSVGMG